MKKQVFAVIWIDASIAFLIPFLTALGIALTPYVQSNSPQPTIVGWLVLICAPVVAGLSALKSFMSTSFSDAQDSLGPKQIPPAAAETKQETKIV